MTQAYAVINNGSSSSQLQDNLNNELSKYQSISQVSGCGIGFGDGNLHAGVLFEASSTTASGSDQIMAEVWSGSMDNIGSYISDFVRALAGTVMSIDLIYDKENNKWRAILVWVTGNHTDYQTYYKSSSKGSSLENYLDDALADSNSIVAFSYAYGNGKNGAIVIYT